MAIISLYCIYVAALGDPSHVGSPVRAVVMQALWYLISIAIVVVVMQFDAEQLFKIAPIFFGFGIVLLIAVLFLYNRSVAADTGAKSWFKLGPITFQDTEMPVILIPVLPKSISHCLNIKRKIFYLLRLELKLAWMES